MKHIHIDNNHTGRDAIINLLHKEKWYWYGMNKDIASIIKICPECNKPFKFKSLSKKKKLFWMKVLILDTLMIFGIYVRR